MYQPLIKFHPHPAIITQVLTIFVEYRMRFGRVKSEMRFPFAFALTFLYICLKLNNCRYALFFDHNSGI